MVVILGQKTSANSEVQRSSALAIQEGSGSPRRIPPRIGRARKARRDSTHSFAPPPFVSFYGYVTSSTRVVRLRGSRQTARAPPRAGLEVIPHPRIHRVEMRFQRRQSNLSSQCAPGENYQQRTRVG